MRVRRFATRGVGVPTCWAFSWTGWPVVGRRRRIRLRRASFLGRGGFRRWWRSFTFLFCTSSWYVIWCHWVTVVVRILVQKWGACYGHFVCSTSSFSKFWLKIWFLRYIYLHRDKFQVYRVKLRNLGCRGAIGILKKSYFIDEIISLVYSFKF